MVFCLATWFGMSITSCSLGFSPSMFIAWRRKKWRKIEDFWDLLEPLVVHGAGADAGFKSMEDCCNVYKLPLGELVWMAGQWSCGIVKNVTFPDRMYAMSLVKYILWLNDLRTYILQEAPCHICADRNIHSPRDVGQINDLLHEGRHLDPLLPDSSGKSFICSHSTQSSP